MPAANPFEEASARACIRALRGLESTAQMLEKFGPELFPANREGQINFAGALMQSAAEAIREAWSIAIREVETFPADESSMVVQVGIYRAALGQIMDLESSEADEPLDDAIAIAKRAMVPMIQPAPA